MAYYYGVVLGHGKQARVEIYERESNKQVVSTTINLGSPYLDSNQVEAILTNLPPVQDPVRKPLNGIISISDLRRLGAKVVNASLSPDVLHKGGVKLLGHNQRVIIDCPAKLTRLVFFDPNNSLQWCEFRDGELVRCNTNVDAVLASSPCSNVFDNIFP